MMSPEDRVIGTIRLLDHLLEAALPAEEYVLVNSAWLALMGIRENGDLDILISRKLWRQWFPGHPTQKSFGIPGPYERKIRVHSMDEGPYGRLEGVADNDDVVYNHRVEIEGIPFVEPRLYFKYKLDRLAKSTARARSIPWWRRNRFLAGPERKTFLKRDKDARDFELIRRYFHAENERFGTVARISDAQWGKNDPSLSFLFP